MRTAVDSNILLDVILDDPKFAGRSEAALRSAAGSGALLVSECVLAELRPALKDGDLDQLVRDLNLDFVPGTRQSADLAGAMMLTYLRRRSQTRTRVIADFLVGAHAVVFADRLLTRDRGFYRDYFKQLDVIEP